MVPVDMQTGAPFTQTFAAFWQAPRSQGPLAVQVAPSLTGAPASAGAASPPGLASFIELDGPSVALVSSSIPGASRTPGASVVPGASGTTDMTGPSLATEASDAASTDASSSPRTSMG